MKDSRAVFVAADIHLPDGADNFRGVLALAASETVIPDTVLLGGDCVGGGKPPAPGTSDPEQLRRWQPEYCLDDVKAQVRACFGERTQVFCTYGSHDKNELCGGFFCGGASCGDFLLYGISFSQMRFADDAQLAETGYDAPDAVCGGAETAVQRFLQWDAELGDSAPLLVMSHIPLHFNRHDNRGAYAWSCALNRVSEHRSVVVFFAHNHSSERRNNIDRAHYLVPVGAEMAVQCAEKEESAEVRLGFTYLNAGYILNGCATVLTFSDSSGAGEYDTLTIKRCALDPQEEKFGDTDFRSPYALSLKG